MVMTPVTCLRELAEPTIVSSMTLSALLVCTDESSAEVLRRVLEELSIQVESCPDFRARRDPAGATALRCRDRRWRLRSEVISLLARNPPVAAERCDAGGGGRPTQESIRELFSLGVNFVLYKPVAHDRALSSLRAARAVMRKEKRKNARAAVHAHATVDYANVEQEKATLIDLGARRHGCACSERSFRRPAKFIFSFSFRGRSRASGFRAR